MPRSLKVVIACDHCGNELQDPDEDHRGALALSINGGPVKQIDLCVECMLGDSNYLYVIGLLDLYENADPLPTTKPTTRRVRNTNGGPAQCPACDHVSGSPQGLGRHTRTEHGMTVAELRGGT